MLVIWKIIKFIATLGGFVTAIILLVNFFGTLPFYDIHFQKSMDITPVISLYPGQKVRISADFTKPVKHGDIKKIDWNLKDSFGNKYSNLPHSKDIDLALLPDFSGTLNVEVKAKLYSDEKERYGEGSIYIVQTKPYKLSNILSGEFFVPLNIDNRELGDVEIYTGSSNWVPANVDGKEGKNTVEFKTEGLPFQVWDGKAFIRYKRTGDQSGAYKYQIAESSNNDLKG